MKLKRRAFTLAELMIGIMIFALMGFAISKLMTNTQLQAAKGRCKAMLRQDLKMAAMYLQRDIESSRVIIEGKGKERKYKSTIEFGDAASTPFTKIETPIRKNPDDATSEEDVSYFDAVENDDDDPTKKLYEEVSYSISGGALTRKGEKSGSHKLADHIEKIEHEQPTTGEDFTYDGKLRLIITLKANIEGFGGEPMELVDHLVISIRQLQNRINIAGGENEEDKNKFRQRIGKDDY